METSINEVSMNQHPYYTCDESGVTVLPFAPTTHVPPEFKSGEVRFAVHKDRTLEISGENFSASKQLSIDEAVGLAMLLLFVVREDTYYISRAIGDFK
ncbi:MAG: hypothetical protein PWQ61_2358 [Betaproteobacteria bacterium]|nr:hypothetical protein [Betaproteobacteria bacterium]